MREPWRSSERMLFDFRWCFSNIVLKVGIIRFSRAGQAFLPAAHVFGPSGMFVPRIGGQEYLRHGVAFRKIDAADKMRPNGGGQYASWTNGYFEDGSNERRSKMRGGDGDNSRRRVWHHECKWQ